MPQNDEANVPQINDSTKIASEFSLAIDPIAIKFSLFMTRLAFRKRRIRYEIRYVQITFRDAKNNVDYFIFAIFTIMTG